MVDGGRRRRYPARVRGHVGAAAEPAARDQDEEERTADQEHIPSPSGDGRIRQLPRGKRDLEREAVVAGVRRERPHRPSRRSIASWQKMTPSPQPRERFSTSAGTAGPRLPTST